MLILSCPLCGESLQATRTQNLEGVIVNETGQVIASQGNALPSVAEVFCTNDHSFSEMRAVLLAARATNPETTPCLTSHPSLSSSKI